MDPNLLSALQALIPVLQQAASGPVAETSAPATSSDLAPPVTAYMSTRPSTRPQSIPSASRGHPNSATIPAPNVFQPFLGPSSLGVSMTANSNQPRHRSVGSASGLTRAQISQANSGRQAAIQSHFPASQPLVPRQSRRTRGPAQHTPSLPPSMTSPESVVDIDPVSGQRYISVDVHVSLPTEQPNTTLHFVQFLYDTLLAFLEDNDLRFTYRLPDDTTVVSLIETVVTDMEASGKKWKFSRSSVSLIRHLRPHESLKLQLLGLVNKGIPRSDGIVLLRRQPADRTLTLAGLLSDSKLFSKPKLCIRQGRLIIKFVVAHSGITCITDSVDGVLRSHECIPSIMHSLFSIENEYTGNLSDWAPPECECDTAPESVVDSDSDTDDVERALLESEAENLPSTPTPASNRPATRAAPLQSATRTRAPPLQSATQAGTARTTQSLPLQPIVEYPQIAGNGELWGGEWVPRPARYGGLFDMGDLTKSIFETASSGSNPSELIVQGHSMEQLVSSLLEQIRQASRSGDFTPILSSDRTFQILRPSGSVLSFGAGVEREVLYSALCHFTKSRGAWFLPRFDDRCSIVTTMPLASSGFVSSERLENLAALGCITALLLIHGIAPEPLSPALIQFAANGFDLGSLTREFVAEWHPYLVGLLDEWLNMDETGDISQFGPFFASYHDMQVAALRMRNRAQHKAMAPEMLYHALIGSQPPSHVELMNFFTGLRLPCSNGFDFFQVIGSYPGGSTTFLSRTWISVIQDFDSLRPHLIIRTPSPDILAQLTGPLTDPIPAELNLRGLLEGFLSGHGTPCPTLLADARGQFSSLIPFDKIDSPSFRSSALCWAVTGSPHVESEDHQRIEVTFVGPNDAGYDASPGRRGEMMALGKIAFRTCFRAARIPVSFIVGLCSKIYPAKDKEGNSIEPFTLTQAIEHWLLMEILGGIGDHSMT